MNQQPGDGRMRDARLRLLKTYASLAQRGEHLLGSLFGDSAPRQWSHYPDDDAFDQKSGFQWFYHSHAPEDRPGAAEHGHIHLFVRRKLWSRRLQSAREQNFKSLAGNSTLDPDTRHLLCIGIDAKGIPRSLFTVNSWVTGDRMLSAVTTEKILDRLKLNTGNKEIDTVIECVVTLCRQEIRILLEERDRFLFSRSSRDILADENFELLSEHPIDLDK